MCFSCKNESCYTIHSSVPQSGDFKVITSTVLLLSSPNAVLLREAARSFQQGPCYSQKQGAELLPLAPYALLLLLFAVASKPASYHSGSQEQHGLMSAPANTPHLSLTLLTHLLSSSRHTCPQDRTIGAPEKPYWTFGGRRLLRRPSPQNELEPSLRLSPNCRQSMDMFYIDCRWLRIFLPTVLRWAY